MKADNVGQEDAVVRQKLGKWEIFSSLFTIFNDKMMNTSY